MTYKEYGPLASIIGTWQGDSGMDIAPESDGVEENPYYETLVCEAAGDLTNAETQQLWVVRYRQEVRRKSNDEVFHDQVGYWMWDEAQQLVIQSLSIPRAVCVLAGGKASTTAEGATQIVVSASLDDPHWNILQSPFMAKNAKTTSYHHSITVKGDSMKYTESTLLDIYGREFDHTDGNTLHRIA
ncbi:MAG: DUF1794 domain-containing protein [Gammaproteobacteria bacterium]|nr:MAG: DUF1794 domain-containing protein [Gammaproteobacteria bacterium]